MEQVLSRLAALDIRFIKRMIEDAMTHPQELKEKLLRNITEYAEQRASDWERSAQ